VSALAGAELGDGGERTRLRRVRGRRRRAGGVELANHHHGARGRAGERPDHDERRRRRVPDLNAQTTGGGETGGNGKVEHQGSQIRARFLQRCPEEGDSAAAVRGTGRGAAALQGLGVRLFFYSRDRGRGCEVRDGVRRLRTSVLEHYRY
jgi:hypothetical protein